MITFQNFQPDHRVELLNMMLSFYQSDAVSHPIEDRIIAKLLDDILSQNNGVEGHEFLWNEELVGFGVLTKSYTPELAGTTVQLEDLYVAPAHRGKGIGKQFIASVMQNHPDASRYRLEVAPSNHRAIKLYRELGFESLDYLQLILE